MFKDPPAPRHSQARGGTLQAGHAAVRTEAPAEELAAVAATARELTARLRATSRELLEVASVDDPDAG